MQPTTGQRRPGSGRLAQPPSSDSLRRAPADPARALVGQEVGGQELLALVSVGNLTWNYEAVDLRGKRALLKLLKPELSEEGVARRLVRWNELLIGVEEAHLLRVLHTGVAPEGAFVCYADPPESTLDQVIAQEAPLPLERALGLARGLLSALEAAHERGVLHLDLRPSKLHVAGPQRLLVADFGFVQALAGSPQLTGRLDPRYSAPEVLGGGALSAESDQYAAALVLYKLLTGKLPFQTRRAQDFAELHASEPPTPPSSYVELPGEVEDALLRALEKSPRDRFPSVADLRRQL
ncbi:MAG TPA: hypothetical protein DEA08_08460 [Planctomycetes bacterium]|nr:hypothetical protein [Planctomycetota bacterium]